MEPPTSSPASPTSAACRTAEALLECHADGQLDAARTLELEAHLERCEGCRERVAFELAFKGSLKRTVRAVTPDDVRARILARVAEARAESLLEDEADAARLVTPMAPPAAVLATDDVALPSLEDAAPDPVPAARRWTKQVRTAVPFAAAAGVFALWSLASHDAARSSTTTSAGNMALAGFGDDVVRDLVAEHSHPLPPERTDPREVRALERYVGVPVRVMRLPKTNARFVGGRVLAVHRERAAMLQYELGDGAHAQRVSVFIYDPRRVQVQTSTLTPRSVGTSEVAVGQTDGYSVAVTQRRGVGYAVATDLDQDTSAQLAVFDEE